jgi:thioredoxin reductase (NADPH)
VDRILASPRIEILTHTEITALHGDKTLSAITLTNDKTHEQQMVPATWVFLCLGGIPHTEWAAEAGITRDSHGYLVTGPDLVNGGAHPKNWPLERAPYHLETSMPGLFAAGDVRHGSIKRCASAVGEGAMAVSFVHRYLAQS